MSYIICFWDKSKLQVSDDTAKKLEQAIMVGDIKNFKLGDNLYAVAGVEKIITKEDAYEVFPTEFERLQNLADEHAVLPTLESGFKQLT